MTVDFNSPLDITQLKPMVENIAQTVSAVLEEEEESLFEFSSNVGKVKDKPITPKTKPKQQFVCKTKDVEPTPKYNLKPKQQEKKKSTGVEALNPDDKKYIDENVGAISIDDMADYLGKRRSTIQRYMEQHQLLSPDDLRDIRVKRRIINSLRNEAFWFVIEEAYSPKEISYFEETWYEFVVQLDDNITATEKLSLKALIENNIRIDRMSIKEQRINNEIDRLTLEIKAAQRRLEYDREDEDLVSELQTLMGELSEQSIQKVAITKDISTLQKDQSTLMKDLDVTRARRVEKYDISDKTWAKMLMEIKENPRLKKQMGAMAYISLLATEYMRGKLTRDYTYADGETHPPMLLPEGLVNKDLTDMVEQLYVPVEGEEHGKEKEKNFERRTQKEVEAAVQGATAS